MNKQIGKAKGIYISVKRLEFLIILAFLSYYFLPVVYSKINFYTILSAGLLYLFAITIFDKRIQKTVFVSLMLIFSIVLLLHILGDVYTFTDGVSKFYYLFMCFFPLFCLYRVYKMQDAQLSRALIVLLFLMFMTVIIRTYAELLINPAACRSFALQTELYKKNIGHFPHIYGTACLISVAPLCMKKMQHPLQKAFVFFITVFLFAFLIKAQYTLALITAFVALILQSYSDRKVTYMKLFTTGILIVILVFSPAILGLIAENIPSRSISIRLSEVAYFLTKGDATGYNMEGRLELYSNAINAFLQHPFTGNRELGFDSHSSYLSVAAHTGILGAAAYYLIHRKTRLNIKCLLKENVPYRQFMPAYIALVITGFTNPILSSLFTNCVVFFYVPLIVLYLNQEPKPTRS